MSTCLATLLGKSTFDTLASFPGGVWPSTQLSSAHASITEFKHWPWCTCWVHTYWRKAFTFTVPMYQDYAMYQRNSYFNSVDVQEHTWTNENTNFKNDDVKEYTCTNERRLLWQCRCTEGKHVLTNGRHLKVLMYWKRHILTKLTLTMLMNWNTQAPTKASLSQFWDMGQTRTKGSHLNNSDVPEHTCTNKNYLNNADVLEYRCTNEKVILTVPMQRSGHVLRKRESPKVPLYRNTLIQTKIILTMLMY